MHVEKLDSDKERKRSSRTTIWDGSLYIIARKSQWFGREDDEVGNVWAKITRGSGRRVGIGSASTLTKIDPTYCTVRTWVKGGSVGVYIECSAVAGQMQAIVCSAGVLLG